MLEQTIKKERILPMEGVYNVRDLGGYRTNQGTIVSWGKAYRAGDLNTLTKQDFAVLEERNINTVIDFRDQEEKDAAPDGKIRTVKHWEEIPIEAGNMMELSRAAAHGPQGAALMAELYRVLVRGTISEYTRFFSVISDPACPPFLFHCSAGKDRTGYAAALFLAALGVDRKTIFEDYLLSAECVWEKYRPFRAKTPELAPMFTVAAEYLEAAFDVIETEYGGMENFLSRHLGADLKLLASLYTESP
ncbi:tyrosine-protein phosphatase [Breznakiella homolactica]|uniref:Tyrosine-protein phosphatase n=1 Tax=Breznakiella homolactica TaxID=2798577 RepID=A0A7T8BBU0_9SPIR|nr:tyrosine-protein phosphatase [Breznakiella homolactica]QQO10415.1 tyrosine-protein phosphatase [Breznakiella homolactica]